jgi:hypothetical protein
LHTLLWRRFKDWDERNSIRLVADVAAALLWTTWKRLRGAPTWNSTKGPRARARTSRRSLYWLSGVAISSSLGAANISRPSSSERIRPSLPRGAHGDVARGCST